LARAANRGLKTVAAVDLADQPADGDAIFDGDEPEPIPDRQFDGDGRAPPIDQHRPVIARK
jgi:hypothetical protein